MAEWENTEDTDVTPSVDFSCSLASLQPNWVHPLGTWNTFIPLRKSVVHNSDFTALHVRHTGEFPRGVGHRVENGWGLTKVAVVLLNGLIW